MSSRRLASRPPKNWLRGIKRPARLRRSPSNVAKDHRMRSVLMLLQAHLLARKARTCLSAAAIACSVCLLMWIASIYASAFRSLDKYASRVLSHYHLVADPVSHRADRETPPE